MVYVDLSKIKPMIAMPFHPSNTYTIEDMNKNLMDVLHDCEQKALVSLDGQVDFMMTTIGPAYSTIIKGSTIIPTDTKNMAPNLLPA